MDYRELVAELARRQEEFAAERAEIDSWSAQAEAAAQAAVERAATAVADATAAVEAARSTVERIDLETHGLWREIGQHGPPPEPAPTADPDDDPDELLEAIRNRLNRLRRAEGDLPGRAVLAICGIIGAGLGYAAAYGARWAALRIGGDFGVFAPVLRQIVTVLAPLLGLIPAKLLADRRQARLDPAAVITVLLAGLVTLGALLLAIGR
jgi:hypothetical protein